MKTYVLDSSALLTLRNKEKGADVVEKILREAPKKNELFVSFISFTEIFYIVYQKQGKGEAIKVFIQLKTLPINKVEPNEDLLMKAGEIKACYSVSLADSFIAATAIQKKAILVHKDPEFEALKGHLEMVTLPYKN